MSHNAARDSSRYQKLLMEGVPSLQAYWDVDLLCRYANRACEHWFGVSPSSLVGTSLRDLLGPEAFALNEAHVRAVLAGQEQSFEQTINEIKNDYQRTISALQISLKQLENKLSE